MDATMERTASLEGIECMEGIRDAGNGRGEGGDKRKGEWENGKLIKKYDMDQPMRRVQHRFAEHDTSCEALGTSDA